MLESVEQAKIGSIVPITKEIDKDIGALDYFAKLSNYGKKKHSIFIEDLDKSYGTSNPCLVVVGKGIEFEIRAFNDTGKKFLQFIKKDFGFCDKVTFGRDRIYGTLSPARKEVSEEQRLKLKSHIDIIRTVAFKFKPSVNSLIPCCGLVGMISYDFIDNAEDLPRNSQDLVNDPDYELYFLDNIFIADNKTKKTYIVANALITDAKKDKIYDHCIKTIRNYEKAIIKKLPKTRKFKKKPFTVSYDTGNEEFLDVLRRIKRHIHDGSILYASPSRLAVANYNSEPFDIYYQLKKISNGLMTFYMNDENGIVMGNGVSANLKVSGQGQKSVELKIATKTQPRGHFKERIDNNLDNKYETTLRVDESGIVKHVMILECARNEAAKVSKAGTRFVNQLFSVEKNDSYQSLNSSVCGVLKEDLDALHVQLATMNFNEGLSKNKSITLLRNVEKTRRGFYSGSIVNIGFDGNLSSATIDSLRLRKDKAYIFKSSDVFHNSNEEVEVKVNHDKIKKMLDAIKAAGGLK